jgi:hypothetical protein
MMLNEKQSAFEQACKRLYHVMRTGAFGLRVKENFVCLHEFEIHVFSRKMMLFRDLHQELMLI